MDRTTNCCSHGGWFTLALAVGTTTSYFSVTDECVAATCIFGDGYRGSMVKVPVKCDAPIFVVSSLRPSLHSALPIPLSLARCLFLQRVRHKFPCVVFGENEDRPGNSVKQKK